jgi:uncharacterized membrane protein YqjE
MATLHDARLTDSLAVDDTVGPLDAIRLLRSAGKTLFAQAGLHAQLASVEWQEEKQRLSKMAGVALLGFASVLSAMIVVGGLAIAFSWETRYRIPAAAGVMAAYALAIFIAWFRLQTLSALGAQAFAATRAELETDIALLRSKL